MALSICDQRQHHLHPPTNPHQISLFIKAKRGKVPEHVTQAYDQWTVWERGWKIQFNAFNGYPNIAAVYVDSQPNVALHMWTRHYRVKYMPRFLSVYAITETYLKGPCRARVHNSRCDFWSVLKIPWHHTNSRFNPAASHLRLYHIIFPLESKLWSLTDRITMSEIPFNRVWQKAYEHAETFTECWCFPGMVDTKTRVQREANIWISFHREDITGTLLTIMYNNLFTGTIYFAGSIFTTKSLGHTLMKCKMTSLNHSKN